VETSLRTPFCDLLGIDVPIVQAPIGSASTPELAAAVAEAGALGVLAVTWVTPEEARRRVDRARELTARPVGVNVVLSFAIDAQLDAALEAGVRVVSTFWGDPATVNDRIHAAGALHLHTVSSAEEARRAVEAGVDVVVGQGWEAGGHVAGQVATMALVPAVVDAVAPVPVVAAGGLGDGRALAAVLALGAQAGWFGTRFVVTDESAAHEAYRRRVVAADELDAVHTTCFDGGWPDAPHRVLRNATLSEWEHAGSPPAPARPREGEITGVLEGRELRRYDDTPPVRGIQGDAEAMALYAGQSAAVIRAGGPARAVVEQLVAEAVAAIERADEFLGRRRS
jgi:NAD(P)H-dependent flavin oxidoreductase YrpB (nitropropane dioxygenase family)